MPAAPARQAEPRATRRDKPPTAAPVIRTATPVGRAPRVARRRAPAPRQMVARLARTAMPAAPARQAERPATRPDKPLTAAPANRTATPVGGAPRVGRRGGAGPPAIGARAGPT